jgi:hypothetical protein
MHKVRVSVVGLLMLIFISFALAACNEGARVGDLQTETQTVELSDADSVDVEIQMGAGNLEVSGGASELLEATFTYNVEELNPQATYSNGRLEIKDSDVDESIRSLFDLDEYRNEWDLRLNDATPMEMNINLGAGRSNLDLSTLALTSLTMDGGAGEIVLDLSDSQSLGRLDFRIGVGNSTIDLTGEWQDDLDARIEGGLGQLNLRLPSDVGVSVQVNTGIGAVEATGLTQNGDTYTNDAFGVSDVTLHIDVEGGVGQINLDVE